MDPISKIIIGVLSAISLALGAAVVWLTVETAHLKTNLAVTQANYSICGIANTNFGAQVKAQNDAVKRMTEAATAREKVDTIATAKDELTAKRYTAQATTLAKHPIDGDACKVAEDIADTYLRGHQ